MISEPRRRLVVVAAVLATATMLVSAPVAGASTLGTVDAAGTTTAATTAPEPDDDGNRTTSGADGRNGTDGWSAPETGSEHPREDESRPEGVTFGDREPRPATRVSANDSARPSNASAVTLVTGQTVYVTRVNGTRQYTVRANVSMQQLSTPKGTYVFPSDVDFSTFDRDLFNVDLLIRQDLTDSESSSIPVIVESSGETRRKVTATTKAFEQATGHGPESRLDSVGAVAGAIEKNNARSAARQLASDRSVDRVHLDVKFNVTLDEANELVNATTARKQYNVSGEGVTVAVLDTGVNESHPALSGDEVLEKDFTDENTTDDLYGHGSHVAGIITADPAASNGTYSGIAPNASIMDLRVLGEDGYGKTSWIVNAMEYATDNDADIISMSLGGGISGVRSNSPYYDGVEYAVDNGTAVVVAAGNAGPGYNTVGDPGVQRHAITVGASNKSLGMADFSSRGPTNGYFVKPDLVATGVNVASVDAFSDGYVSYSGTSMATPVVSGAAALALEKNPSWGPDRLKNALVSSAEPLGDEDVYTQGAGQLNVTAALDPAVVVDEATIDFGEYNNNTTVTKTFTVTNTGNATRTLTLSASATDITDGSAGTVSLNRTSVTLGAGNSTTVELTVVTGSEAGIYSGRISVDGGTAGAIFGWARTYELTISKRAIRSTQVDYDMVAVQANHSTSFGVTNTFRTLDNGTDTVTYDLVSSGPYYVVSQGRAEDNNQPIVVVREVDVTGSTQVTLDESNTVERAVNMSQPENVSGPLDVSYLEVYHREFGPHSAIASSISVETPATSTVRVSTQRNLTVATERAFVTNRSRNYPGELNSSDVYYLYDKTTGIEGATTRVVNTTKMGAKRVTYHRTKPGVTYRASMTSSSYDFVEQFLDAFSTEWSGSVGNRTKQRVFVSTAADSHTISARKVSGNDTWSLNSYAGSVPPAGFNSPVSVNRHPMFGEHELYFQSDGDFYYNAEPQKTDSVTTFNASGTVELLVNGSLRSSDTFDDGRYYNSTTLGAGADVVFRTTATNDVMPRSNRTVSTSRVTYRPSRDSEPPELNRMEVTYVDEHNRAPNGTTVVRVSAYDFDSNVTNMTVLWARDAVTSVPFDSSGVRSGTAWQEGRVVRQSVGDNYAYMRVALNTSGYTGNVSIAVRAEDEHGNSFETTTFDGTVVTGELTNEVTGTVKESDGSAAADDTLTTLNTAHRTFTDSNGSFGLALPNRSYGYDVGYLQADLDTSNPTWARDGSPDIYGLARVPGDNATSLGTITLPDAYEVDVTVVDEGGDPVRNATVTFVHQNDNGAAASHQFRTAGDGKVYAGANTVSGLELVGEVDVYVEPPESPKYGSTWYTRDLNVTSNTSVTVTLEEVEYVTGQVDENDSSAAAYDEINLESPRSSNAGFGYTNATGHFNESVSGEDVYDVILAQENETTDTDTERDGTPDVYTIDRRRINGTVDVGNVDLPKGHLVNVTVVDEQGNPIENVTPYIAHRPEYASNASSEPFFGIQSNANGRFRSTTNVTPGFELTGHVEMWFVPKTEAYQTAQVELNVTGDRQLTVTLEDKYTIEGRLLENDGSAASADRLFTWGVTVDEYRYDLLDSDGRFLEGVTTNGTYDLVAVQRNESNGDRATERDGTADIYTVDRIDVQGNDTSLGTVTLPKGHLVNVTVVNESGAPLEGVDVQVAHRPDYAPNATGNLYLRTNSEGRLVQNADVPPGVELNGSVELRFYPDGNEYETKTVALNVSSSRQLTVTLNRTPTATGRLTNSSGAGLPEDWVIASDHDGLEGYDLTNTTGNYSLSVPENGTYGFTVMQVNWTVNTVTERDGTADLYYLGNDTVRNRTDLGTDAVPDGHVVNVTVVDESGAPVENATVRVEPGGQAVHDDYSWDVWFNTTDRGMVNLNPNNTTAGIELSGNVTLNVSRPEGDERFVDEHYVRNITVTGSRDLTVTLEEAEWSTLNQTWTFRTDGRVQYAQVVAGTNLVYAAGLDDTVYALNRSTGEVVWRFNRSGSLADSSPTLQGDTLYVGSGGGVVYALNASTGATEWNYTTDSAVVSSPTVDNGTVYVGSNDGTVVALDGATGSVQWTHEAGAAVLSEPAVGNGSVYVTTDAGDVVSLDRSTGNKEWTVDTGVTLGHSSPAFENGTVYVAADTLYALDASGGTVDWQTPYGGTAGGSPTVVSGTVYVGADNGTVTAVDATTGAITWQFAAGATVASTPGVANDRVVAATTAGDVYLLNASTGSTVASNTLATAVRSPATVATQAAFVGSRNGTVVAFGSSSSTSSSSTTTDSTATDSTSTDTTTTDSTATDSTSTDSTSTDSTSDTESADGTSSSDDVDAATDGTGDPTASSVGGDATPVDSTDTDTSSSTATPTGDAGGDGVTPASAGTETGVSTPESSGQAETADATSAGAGDSGRSPAALAMAAPAPGIAVAILALLGGGLLVAARRRSD